MNYLIGAIGMIFTIYGTLLTCSLLQNLCFLLGGTIMLLSAYREKHEYFIALQTIAIIGVLMSFLKIDPLIKGSIPILISLLLICYFYAKKQLSSGVNILGALGITILAVGYAFSQPLIYFIGGIVLTIYSLLSFLQGARIAMLWCVLNLIFSVTSGYAVYRSFLHG